MRLLIDTNIIIDFALRREPFFEQARLLMTLGELGEFDLFISGSQITDVYYLLSNGGKESRAEPAKRFLRSICDFVRIVPIGQGEIQSALDSDWNDFEDACVYQAARSVKADAIITRNRKDFEKSHIKVFGCDGFFEWLKNAMNVEYTEMPL